MVWGVDPLPVPSSRPALRPSDADGRSEVKGRIISRPGTRLDVRRVQGLDLSVSETTALQTGATEFRAPPPRPIAPRHHSASKQAEMMARNAERCQPVDGSLAPSMALVCAISPARNPNRLSCDTKSVQLEHTVSACQRTRLVLKPPRHSIPSKRDFLTL